MTDDNKNKNEETPKVISAQDRYAAFIKNQRSHQSMFDTSATKPVSAQDIGISTGKIDK